MGIEEEKRPTKKKNPSNNLMKDEMEEENDDDRKNGNKSNKKMEVEKGFDSEEENVIKEVEENLRNANVKINLKEIYDFFL